MFLDKAVLLLSTVGGLGIASMESYKMFAPKTIRDRLVFYGRETPLSEEHSDQWKKLIEKYKTVGTSKPLGELNFSQESNSDIKNIETMQDACLKLLRTSLTENDIDKKIENAKDWCLLSSKNLST